MLGTPCCFQILDKSNNLPSFIEYMQQDVHTPPEMGTSGLNWIQGIFGVFSSYTSHVISLIRRCVLRSIQGLVKGERSYQLVKVKPDELPDRPPRPDEDYESPFSDVDDEIMPRP